MGKPEEEHLPSLPNTSASQNAEHNSVHRCRSCEIVRFRCMLAVLLGASVLLSALFWLPPFSKHLDRRDLDLDSRLRSYEIGASFMLDRPVSLLDDNIYKLEDDIFTEIAAPTTKVKILFLLPSHGLNRTKVYFAVVPYEQKSGMSSTGRSLIRANFVSLVIQQSILRLSPLFGDPYSFEVLKFPGGITIIPPQDVFLLQKVQILFNFTLIASIDRTHDNFYALTEQLKSGLHLASYENLYIKLTNPKGSTVDAPTILQTAVVLAIGNKPSQTRLKQLAHTITDPHAKNLGLNNTVFGKVKQVRLSSVPQPSLGSDSSPAPAPSPLSHHRRHHHHGHHRHHRAETQLAPIVTPAPSPATKFRDPEVVKGSPGHAPVPSPMRSHMANPPGCQFGYHRRPRKGNKQFNFPPVESPAFHRHIAPSPRQHVAPPAHVSSPSPALSPLPHPLNAHVQPPAKSEPDTSPLKITPSVSPTPSSSAGLLLPPRLWVALKFVVLALLL